MPCRKDFAGEVPIGWRRSSAHVNCSVSILALLKPMEHRPLATGRRFNEACLLSGSFTYYKVAFVRRSLHS